MMAIYFFWYSFSDSRFQETQDPGGTQSFRFSSAARHSGKGTGDFESLFSGCPPNFLWYCVFPSLAAPSSSHLLVPISFASFKGVLFFPNQLHPLACPAGLIVRQQRCGVQSQTSLSQHLGQLAQIAFEAFHFLQVGTPWLWSPWVLSQLYQTEMVGRFLSKHLERRLGRAALSGSRLWLWQAFHIFSSQNIKELPFSKVSLMNQHGRLNQHGLLKSQDLSFVKSQAQAK